MIASTAALPIQCDEPKNDRVIYLGENIGCNPGKHAMEANDVIQDAWTNAGFANHLTVVICEISRRRISNPTIRRLMQHLGEITGAQVSRAKNDNLLEEVNYQLLNTGELDIVSHVVALNVTRLG